jgi:hypothetical protein
LATAVKAAISRAVEQLVELDRMHVSRRHLRAIASGFSEAQPTDPQESTAKWDPSSRAKNAECLSTTHVRWRVIKDLFSRDIIDLQKPDIRLEEALGQTGVESEPRWPKQPRC